MIPISSLRQKQSLNLEQKEILSLKRIKDFYMYNNTKTYIAFSGGLDSTVLLHLIRRKYNIKGIFSNTGLEFPETIDFIKTFPNIKIIYPKYNFIDVIKNYGYPVISKEVSKNIQRYNNTFLETQKEYRLYGTMNGIEMGKSGIIPKKYHYLIKAPFLISDKCCDILKKNPFKEYEKETNERPFIGTLAQDSLKRTFDYTKSGCNSFINGKEKSRPLSFWLRKDIFEYIKKYNLKINPVYNMGEKHTGCIFCMFGVHLENNPNRFQRMKIHHPNLYKYCINQLNLKKILDFINVKY